MSTLPPGDITAAWNAATSTTPVLLGPGPYTLNGAQIKNNGVRILGDVKTPAQVTLLDVGATITGDNVEIAGVHFESKVGGGGWRKVFEMDGKGFNCHDCSADRISNFAVINGDNSRFTKVYTGFHVGGDIYYDAAQGSVLTDITCDGITNPGEHLYRSDVGKTGRIPTNNSIIGGTWIARSGSGKEAWAIRRAVNFTGDGASIGGYIRAGQSAGDNNVSKLTLKNLTFLDNLPAFTLIDIHFGVTGILGKYAMGLPGHPFTQKQAELAVGPNSKITRVP